jgi:hypothetical protein
VLAAGVCSCGTGAVADGETDRKTRSVRSSAAALKATIVTVESRNFEVNGDAKSVFCNVKRQLSCKDARYRSFDVLLLRKNVAVVAFSQQGRLRNVMKRRLSPQKIGCLNTEILQCHIRSDNEEKEIVSTQYVHNKEQQRRLREGQKEKGASIVNI